MTTEDQARVIRVAALRVRDSAIIAEAIQEALDMSIQIDENDASGVRKYLRKARRLAADYEGSSLSQFNDLVQSTVILTVLE